MFKKQQRGPMATWLLAEQVSVVFALTVPLLPYPPSLSSPNLPPSSTPQVIPLDQTQPFISSFSSH